MSLRIGRHAHMLPMRPEPCHHDSPVLRGTRDLRRRSYIPLTVAEFERRFRDEALTSAAQAATIILDGVKADRWRILVGPDAHKIDEMVRQSPERAYDIAFFDEFARAAGWTDRLSLDNPELRPPS